MRIRCPSEITIHWLNDWAYYADLDCALVQLQVEFGSRKREAIVKLVGLGFRWTLEFED